MHVIYDYASQPLHFPRPIVIVTVSNPLGEKMMKRFCSGFDLSERAMLLTSCAVTEQQRFWVKPKKRPKVGAGFQDKAQKWREEYLLDRHRILADGLKAYVEFSSQRRTEPWDTRFKPFDRVEKDGAHILVKYLMEDKLNLAGYHPRATKRLMCNVGLLGPTVTTTARWKPFRFAQLSATTTKADRLYTRDRSIATGGYSDV